MAPRAPSVAARVRSEGGRAPRPRGTRPAGLVAPPVPQHKAPTTRASIQCSARPARTFARVQNAWTPRSEAEGALEEDDDVAGHADAVARLALEAARATQLDALVDRQPAGARARVQVCHERAGGRAGGRVLGHRGDVEEEAPRARRLPLGVAQDDVRARAPDAGQQVA